MKNFGTMSGVGAAVVLGLWGSAAPAQEVHAEPKPAEHKEGAHGEEGYPLSYVERPLTVPKMMLRPDFEVAVINPDGAKVGFETSLTVHFGVTNDFELEGFVWPMTWAEAGTGEAVVNYGNPGIGALYRFFHSREFEVGAGLRLFVLRPLEGLPTGGFLSSGPTFGYFSFDTGLLINPRVPFRFHFGKEARLDAGIEFFIDLGEEITGFDITTGEIEKGAFGSANYSGMSIPLAFSYDITEPLHVGLSSGFRILSFDNADQTALIPMGLSAGYAIGGKKGPLLDIDPFLRWPGLFTPGSSGDKARPGYFETGVEASFYLNL